MSSYETASEPAPFQPASRMCRARLLSPWHRDGAEGLGVVVTDGPVTAMWCARVRIDGVTGPHICPTRGAGGILHAGMPGPGVLHPRVSGPGALHPGLPGVVLPRPGTAAMCPQPVPTAAPSPRCGHAHRRSQWASGTRAPPTLAPPTPILTAIAAPPQRRFPPPSPGVASRSLRSRHDRCGRVLR